MVTRKRHFLKAITWRIIALTTTTLIVLWVTGDFEIVLAVMLLETIIKIILYYIHERIWYKNTIGIKI